MGTRLELHDVLVGILGAPNVYFQPPESIKLKYPCILYKKDKINSRFADNNPYSLEKRYSVTFIDSNPDSSILDDLANLPMCIFDRHYTSNGMNHDVYILYF
jgi:hypothetical protein